MSWRAEGGEPEAANLFFQLVSSRYERASLIVTSNKNFARWGEVFGDDTVAAAMIDRLVHHAEVIALKGDSYRLKNRELGRVPPDPQEWRHGGSAGTTVDRGSPACTIARARVIQYIERLVEILTGMLW